MKRLGITPSDFPPYGDPDPGFEQNMDEIWSAWQPDLSKYPAALQDVVRKFLK